ncbi:zinc ribbon domain-containing protein [Paenibacillus sp. MMS20-IR301]|uniref:zinc ribbon domain-containing protein n=1 Tax=Paenibacillus sp. MMS20-IR301 TaxID=2895946 RepID=UPI0028E29A1F|nr:zinc ribbon domain-containing protein [Paenibacillus sp. MMS20-IR301]WNS41640.1 zinc ribbon domain-containing protein [Paenibacillus sp. MMS20-IR301]
MMETKSAGQPEGLFCQSCGMPVESAELQGTDKAGNKVEDYCMYCYEQGEFKQPNITLQEMTDLCAGYLIEEGMDEAAARQMLNASLPLLKRWSTGTPVH